MNQLKNDENDECSSERAYPNDESNIRFVFIGGGVGGSEFG